MWKFAGGGRQGRGGSSCLTGLLGIYLALCAATVMAQTPLPALDIDYYVNKYPDLKAAFGNNRPAILNHWMTYGHIEGRSPNPNVGDAVYVSAKRNNLDLYYYVNKYPDLRAAFGEDPQRLHDHYMTYGRTEGRFPNKKTDDFLTPPPRSAHLQANMRVGDWLYTNEWMLSPNKRFMLIVQDDLNLCEYETSDIKYVSGGNLRWCQFFPKNMGPSKSMMVIQADGHLCDYRATSNGAARPTQGQGVACTPGGAGGPNGRYFLALQDDGNVVIYKGGGPDDNRGWIWDRITTKPSSGFSFSALAESVATFTVSSANTVANTAVSTANTVANTTVSTANAVGRETVTIANTTASTAVTVGNRVQDAGKIAGNEIVAGGKYVGMAVANLAQDAWSYLNQNCGTIGRQVFPVDQYFQGAIKINNAIAAYGTADMKAKANQANQCYGWAQDGFYCSFPAEISKIVSQAGSMPGNLINLSERVYAGATEKDCLYTLAGAPLIGAAGPPVCGLGKIIISDATKAYQCYVAAQSKGVVKKVAPGLNINFPDQSSCNGIGQLAFSVGEKIATNAVSAEAKAAQAAGKGRTVAVVADELRTIYKIAGAASQFDALTNELQALPECKD